MDLMKLSRAEINRILSLMSARDTEGWYYGPKDQYEKRHERIRKKLLVELGMALEASDA